MDDCEVRIPNVPLADVDDDIDSNRNSNSDNEVHISDSSDGERLEGDLSGSLEDLVGNLDAKINSCLKDLGEKTEDIAPVQVRTQDEIMSESQIWWTLTGNFGNIMPLDFQNSQIRRNMMPGLNLSDRKSVSPGEDNGVEMSDEEDLRNAMDMHTLISQGMHIHSDSPPQTADQVIEEIDEMLQSCDLTGSMMTDRTMESVDSMYSSMRSPLPSGNSSETDTKMRQAAALAANPENLQALSYSKLVTLNAEMEQLIQVYNESLVEELAHRDELEFEKYMTASIPFNDGAGPLDNATLSSLIKILKAINEDSPQVPSMLTDYILTVVCPSAPKMTSSIVC